MTEPTERTYTDAHGVEIVFDHYPAAGDPRAVVQLLHGIGEHARRYGNLIDALTADGYIVYADDHRGHRVQARSRQVIALLMIQLQNVSRVIMVLLTAPLGIIGIALFLLVFRQPFGFMALLGTIALFGMIMRNSVILVDQIEQDLAAGKARWEAIVESTVRRFRPIVLTAAAAVLAMIPLSRNDFFGPMAVAIMGGLIVATALTLLFLPALYAAWYKVKSNS